MNIQIINGPNLNLFGTREPHIYGSESLEDIKIWFEGEIDTAKHLVNWFQSNHEGEIIDQIHKAINAFNGIIINAGALTHYSYAIRDAIKSVDIPAVEVHLTDISLREDFRKISVISDVCINQIKGIGKNGYLKAFKLLMEHTNQE